MRQDSHALPRRATALLAGLLLLAGCDTLRSVLPWTGNSEDVEEKVDYTKIPPEQIYNNGVDALSAQRYVAANNQFDAVEQYYPYSSWAVNAQLMQGYTEYQQNHYTDAIGTLDRFIQLHPAHRDVAYAYYLRSLCYYEQIADIERDQKGTELAINALQDVVNRFPDSA